MVPCGAISCHPITAGTTIWRPAARSVSPGRRPSSRKTPGYEQRSRATDAISFTVYERLTQRPIGIAYLYDVDARHARASFGITIGESDCRGKGYGTEATRLVLDYAFNAYGLQNVMLTVVDFNRAGRRAYEKAGFREFGRRRTCSRFGQQLCDLIYMECVATEFAGSALTGAG